MGDDGDMNDRISWSGLHVKSIGIRCKPQEESPESIHNMFCQDYIYLESLLSVAFRMQSRHDRRQGSLDLPSNLLLNEKMAQ